MAWPERATAEQVLNASSCESSLGYWRSCTRRGVKPTLYVGTYRFFGHACLRTWLAKNLSMARGRSRCVDVSRQDPVSERGSREERGREKEKEHPQQKPLFDSQPSLSLSASLPVARCRKSVGQNRPCGGFPLPPLTSLRLDFVSRNPGDRSGEPCDRLLDGSARTCNDWIQTHQARPTATQLEADIPTRLARRSPASSRLQ